MGNNIPQQNIQDQTKNHNSVNEFQKSKKALDVKSNYTDRQIKQKYNDYDDRIHTQSGQVGPSLFNNCCTCFPAEERTQMQQDPKVLRKLLRKQKKQQLRPWDSSTAIDQDEIDKDGKSLKWFLFCGDNQDQAKPAMNFVPEKKQQVPQKPGIMRGHKDSKQDQQVSFSLFNNNFTRNQMILFAVNPQMLRLTHVPHLNHLIKELVQESDQESSSSESFDSNVLSESSFDTGQEQEVQRKESLKAEKKQLEVKKELNRQLRGMQQFQQICQQVGTPVSVHDLNLDYIPLTVQLSMAPQFEESSIQLQSQIIFKVIKYDEGNFYYGQVKQIQSQESVIQNTRHGIGRFIKKDEYEYVGIFKQDLRNGDYGLCFYKNGDFYSGSWKNDLFHSNNAIFVSNDASFRYIGSFRNGTYHGQGVIYQQVNSNFGKEIHISQGNFQLGKPNGFIKTSIVRCPSQEENQEFQLDKAILDVYIKYYDNDGNLVDSQFDNNFDQIILDFPELLCSSQIVLPIGQSVTYRNQQTMSCFEELDSQTLVQELLLKYPRIDLQWTAQKQVAWWLYAIRLDCSESWQSEIIQKFIDLEIDGFELLSLQERDLFHIFLPQQDLDQYMQRTIKNSSQIQECQRFDMTDDQNLQLPIDERNTYHNSYLYDGQNQNSQVYSKNFIDDKFVGASSTRFINQQKTQSSIFFGQSNINFTPQINSSQISHFTSYKKIVSRLQDNQSQVDVFEGDLVSPTIDFKRRNEAIINIEKILIQLEKLKILWYKTLKKQKLLHEASSVLKKLGIVFEATTPSSSSVEDLQQFSDFQIMNKNDQKFCFSQTNLLHNQMLSTTDLKVRKLNTPSQNQQKQQIYQKNKNDENFKNQLEDQNKFSYQFNFSNTEEDKQTQDQKIINNEKAYLFNQKNNQQLFEASGKKQENLRKKERFEKILTQNYLNSLRAFYSNHFSSLCLPTAQKELSIFFKNNYDQIPTNPLIKRFNNKQADLREFQTLNEFFDHLEKQNVLYIPTTHLSQVQVDYRSPNQLKAIYLGTKKVILKEQKLQNRWQIQKVLNHLLMIELVSHPCIKMAIGFSIVNKSQLDFVDDDIEQFLDENKKTLYTIEDDYEPQSYLKTEQGKEESSLKIYLNKLNQWIEQAVQQDILLEEQNSTKNQQQKTFTLPFTTVDPNNFNQQQVKQQKKRILASKTSQLFYFHLFKITKQIIQALKKLHSNGIAHGDVCLDNILVQFISPSFYFNQYKAQRDIQQQFWTTYQLDMLLNKGIVTRELNRNYENPVQNDSESYLKQEIQSCQIQILNFQQAYLLPQQQANLQQDSIRTNFTCYDNKNQESSFDEDTKLTNQISHFLNTKSQSLQAPERYEFGTFLKFLSTKNSSKISQSSSKKQKKTQKLEESSYLSVSNDIYQLGVMLFKIVQTLHYQTNLPFVTLNQPQKVKRNLQDKQSLWNNLATVFAAKNIAQQSTDEMGQKREDSRVLLSTALLPLQNAVSLTKIQKQERSQGQRVGLSLHYSVQKDLADFIDDQQENQEGLVENKDHIQLSYQLLAKTSEALWLQSQTWSIWGEFLISLGSRCTQMCQDQRPRSMFQILKIMERMEQGIHDWSAFYLK